MNLSRLLSKRKNTQNVRKKYTFPSRSSDCNPVSGLEKLSLRDGVVYLGFKDPKETVLAYLLPGLWTPQNGFRVLAEGAALRRHRRWTGSTSESKLSQVKSRPKSWSTRAGNPECFTPPHLLDQSFVAATMPKELRKRGKKHKKSSAENQTHAQKHEVLDEGPSSGPSWIAPRANSSSTQFNPEAPFGYVDPELKAYFKTVDDQLKDWQQNRNHAEGEEDVDPNESTASCLACVHCFYLTLFNLCRA